jgi:hypothetical protein
MSMGGVGRGAEPEGAWLTAAIATAQIRPLRARAVVRHASIRPASQDRAARRRLILLLLRRGDIGADLLREGRVAGSLNAAVARSGASTAEPTSPGAD